MKTIVFQFSKADENVDKHTGIKAGTYRASIVLCATSCSPSSGDSNFNLSVGVQGNTLVPLSGILDFNADGSSGGSLRFEGIITVVEPELLLFTSGPGWSGDYGALLSVNYEAL